MGRGAIVSGGAGGLYQLEIRRFTDRAESNKTELEAAEVEADLEIVAAISAKADAVQGLSDAADAQDAAIAAYKAETGTLEEVQETVEGGIRARDTLEQAQLRLDNAHGRRASIKQELRQIDEAIADPTVQAWCADLTEDLAVDTLVGTIEIPDEKGSVSTIIRPSFNPGTGSRGAYDSTRDGALQPVISTTPQGFLRNAGYLPGSQKWLPQYRLGTITALDSGTGLADITLDAAISTGYLPEFAQGIDVNQTPNLVDVPIEYLYCNADPFAPGDHVVVEFDRDWATRKIIGFADNPKPCTLLGIYVRASDDVTPPYEQRFQRKSGEWTATTPVAPFPLNIFWRNANSGDLVSWKGPKGGDVGLPRHTLGSVYPGVNGVPDVNANWYVYQNFGTGLLVNGTSETAPEMVVAAAMVDRSGQKYLVAITSDNVTATDTFREKLWPAGSWTVRDTWAHPTDVALHDVGWRFNESGNAASCVLAEFVTPFAPDWKMNHYRLSWPETGPVLVALVESAPSPSFVQTGSETLSCTFGDGSTSSINRIYTQSGNYPAAVNYAGDTEIVARCVSDGGETEVGNASLSGSNPNWVMPGTISLDRDMQTRIEWSSPSGSGSEVVSRQQSTESYNNLYTGSTGFTTVNNTIDRTLEQRLPIFLDLRFNTFVAMYRVDVWTYSAVGDDDIGDAVAMFNETTHDEELMLANSVSLQNWPGPTTADNRNRPFYFNGDSSYAGPADGLAIADISVCLTTPELSITNDLGDSGNLSTMIVGVEPTIEVWPSQGNQPWPHGATDGAGNLMLSLELQYWLDYGTDPDRAYNYLTGGDPVTLAGLLGANPYFIIRGTR